VGAVTEYRACSGNSARYYRGDHMSTPTADPIVKCGSCDVEGPWRRHSGVYECQDCWDWRKLDSNAARYYFKLSLMFLSSVDAHDRISFFPKTVGLSDEDMVTLSRIMKQIHEKTNALAEAHNLKEHWTTGENGAQELFRKL
jgi:hypothetical protein